MSQQNGGHLHQNGSGKQHSAILDWYKGRSIFITGGTGFMGKVLVEKLLYTCDVDTVYILMRPKRGRTVEQRIQDIWKLPVFERLRTSKPSAINKIRPVHGDIVTDGLGLSKEELSLIVENASIVFHCAATLKLEATIQDAVEMNTMGTQRAVDVAKQIKGLRAFIHMSTAFCSADIEVFEEKLYPCPENPRHVIEVTQWMDAEALAKATSSLIKPHPNCYTFSKRLAETLVANEMGTMRVAIVRPSIVTPACLEPVRGWVDSLNGPMGLLVAAGKGVLRSMHCNGEHQSQVIPVDYAINGMLIVAYKLGSAKEAPEEVPVYNMTNAQVQTVTWKDVLDKGRSTARKFPFEMMIWYPDGDMRSSYFIHQINCIFQHWIPAYFIDFLMFVFRQKRFMVRIQTKIHDGLELLQFFTTRQWVFESGKFLQLYKDLTSYEKTQFPMDFFHHSVDEYLEDCIKGARQYCMKEDPSTLPRCRVQQNVLFLLHYGLKVAFYLGIIWWVYSKSDCIQESMIEMAEWLLSTPIFGSVPPLKDN